jgi:hypothetical protein
VANASSDRCKGSNDRNEPGEDHGEPTETGEERISALNVLDAEQPGFFTLKDPWTRLMANQIADFTTEERSEADGESDPPDLEIEALRRSGVHSMEGEQSGDDEKCVTREQETDEQAGFGKNNEAHDKESPWASRTNDAFGIEPGNETCRNHGRLLLRKSLLVGGR